MCGLKICLWLAGVLCLLSVFGVFLPVSTWESFIGFFGLELLPDSPLFDYVVRVTSATFVGVGVFFLIPVEILKVLPLVHMCHRNRVCDEKR